MSLDGVAEVEQEKEVPPEIFGNLAGTNWGCETCPVSLDVVDARALLRWRRKKRYHL